MLSLCSFVIPGVGAFLPDCLLFLIWSNILLWMSGGPKLLQFRFFRESCSACLCGVLKLMIQCVRLVSICQVMSTCQYANLFICQSVNLIMSILICHYVIEICQPGNTSISPCHWNLSS